MSIPGEGVDPVVPAPAEAGVPAAPAAPNVDPAVVERLEQFDRVAKALGPMVGREFARRKTVVDEQLSEADIPRNPDGTIMKSSAMVAMDRVTPSTAAVEIIPRPRTKNPMSWISGQAVDRTDSIIFGWTVYEGEREAPRGTDEEGKPTGPDLLSAEFADEEVSPEVDEPVFRDPTAIVERVVLTNSKKHPLWKIEGTRAALEVSGPELTRIPRFPANLDDKKRAAVEEYAVRNEFVSREDVVVTPIRIEDFRDGALTFHEDPAHVVDMIGAGIARLSREVAPAQPATPPTA